MLTLIVIVVAGLIAGAGGVGIAIGIAVEGYEWVR